MTDRITRRRLEDWFRSANWNDLTADEAAEAGIPEASRAEFVRRAAAIHEAYGDGDHGEAIRLAEEAVEEFGEVPLGDVETTDPRALAAHALGETPDPEADPETDPRALARDITI